MFDPAALARRARTNAGGGIAIMAALSLTAMIGFAALGTEVALVYYKQSQMQSAASSAALGGAAALMAGQTSAYAVKEAQAIAAGAGFTSGTAGATVTVNTTYLGATAIEVIIAQLQPYLLSSLFLTGTGWNIGARAAATPGNSAADCILVLDTSSFTTSQTAPAYINNGATVTLTNCGLADNASGAGALAVTGATLKAASVTITGSDTLSNGGVITTTPTANNVKTAQAATVNPYASVAVPAYGACGPYGSSPTTAYFPLANATLSPGVYCGGLTINAAGITMKTGTYWIVGNIFSVTSGGALTNAAGGVTIVLTGSGSNFAYLDLTGGTTTLSAQTTTTTAGMLIFQDPADPTTATHNTSYFQGGATANLTGALYFPTQIVNYSNGASSNSSACTQLIAWQVQFTGGASFANSCSSAGTKTIGTTPSTLVE